MKILGVLFCFFLLSLHTHFVCLGQEGSSSLQEQTQQAIDSLQGLLIQVEDDSLRAVLYTNISGTYLFANKPSDALAAANKALVFAQKVRRNNMISNAYAQLGRIYMETSEYPSSIDAYQMSIAALGDTGYIRPKAYRLQMLGKAYELQGILDIAEKQYQEAYQLLDANQDTSRGYLGLLSFALNNLGNTATLQEKFEEGLKYQLKAIDIRRQLSDTLNLAYSYNDIAIIYGRMDKPEQAQTYYEKAWDIFVLMGKKRELAIIGNNLAGIHLGLNQAKKALEYGLVAIKNAYAVQDKSTIMSNSLTLAYIYSELGMYKEAFEAQQNHTAYRDSIFNEQRLREIGRLESKIELQEKEAENQRQQITIEQQQTTNIIIGSALILVLFLASLLLRLQQRQKKANRLLQLQKEELHQQKEELSAQAEVLTEANEEIKQQKEEIYAQAETLRSFNQEIQEKNTLLVGQNEVIRKTNTDIMSSITYASRIQQALLPFKVRLEEAFLEYFVLFQPRDMVSGDFYWFADIAGVQVIAAIDCTGHGVPGAFMSVLGHGALDDIVLRQGVTSPEKILENLHQYIKKVLQQDQTENRDGMDAAICVLDRHQQQLQFAGAKNPLIIFQHGEMKVVKGDTKSIGGQERGKGEYTFTRHDFELDTPTSFYIYSDGYQDQFGGPHGKKLMTKNFRQLINETHHKPMQEQQQFLEEKLRAWMGEEHKQIDDILIIGARV